MKGRRPRLKAVSDGLAGSAPLPAHVPKACQTEWNRIVSDLAARKLLVPATLGSIAAYVLAQWQVAECVKAIQCDGAFVLTKAGQPKPHPALGPMNKAQEIIARLGSELGLTPTSRSRKALQVAEEAADDGAPAGLDL